VILRQGRFVAVAAVVVFAAFFFGLGTFLTGAQPPAKPQPAGHASAAQRSGDDDGFSMTLAEPREHYLVGIRRIVIEPTLPPGDNVAGVDFFVDGRLVATLRGNGAYTCLVTGGFTLFSRRIAALIGFDENRANTLVIDADGRLTGDVSEPIFGREAKLATLIELRGADLLRVKGFVPVESGLVAVQGVRHVFDRLRPVERGEPALVFITNGVSQGEVQALWQAMKGLA